MTMQERQRRALVLEAEERKGPLGLWYLSFASEEGFLGGCVVEAYGINTAITKAHELGINPGGEVMSMEIDPTKLAAGDFRNRLLNKAQLTEVFGPLSRG